MDGKNRKFFWVNTQEEIDWLIEKLSPLKNVKTLVGRHSIHFGRWLRGMEIPYRNENGCKFILSLDYREDETLVSWICGREEDVDYIEWRENAKRVPIEEEL